MKTLDIKLQQQDVLKFKNISLFFLLGKIGSLIINFAINNVIGYILGWIASILLIYGIYVQTKKYSSLPSGLRVVYLFIISVVIDFVSRIFTLLNPIPINTLSTTTNLNTEIAGSISQFYLLLDLFTVISAIVILVTSYYFVEWFNSSFGKFNPTRSYFYYGIIFCSGELIVGINMFQFGLQVQTILSNGNTTDLLITLISAFSINTMAASFLFISNICEIIAGFIIYNHLSDLSMGITKFNSYAQVAFNQPLTYQQTPFQPIFDENFSQTGHVNQKTSNSISSTGKVESYCENCGNKLLPTSTFCGACGKKML